MSLLFSPGTPGFSFCCADHLYGVQSYHFTFVPKKTIDGKIKFAFLPPFWWPVWRILFCFLGGIYLRISFSYTFHPLCWTLCCSCVLEQARWSMDITKLTQCWHIIPNRVLDVEVKCYNFISLTVFSGDIFHMCLNNNQAFSSLLPIQWCLKVVSFCIQHLATPCWQPS